ncbi:MAG TPA: DUF2155 domain-containing protein [Stellaceae bacterium]|jgi:hypothetical protein|nr:DUF2155 domain-containing protein [Stellaceae bacterium]
MLSPQSRALIPRAMKHILFAVALLALAMAGMALAQQKPAPTKAPPAAATAAAPAVTIAVLQGLDKTTARVSTVEAPIAQSVRFGTLVITARACVKKPPEDPPNTAAFLEIDEARPQGAQAGTDMQHLFSGWMFAQSPALSTLEHPVYDVTVLDCKTEMGSSAKPSSK